MVSTHSVVGSPSITLLALFEEKALFHIDGQRRLLHTGQTSPEGVNLIRVDSTAVEVEINGRRESLQLGMATTFPGENADPDPAWSGPQTVSFWADPNGSFFVQGAINGYPVRFLVDTGATTVAISGDLAKRIGIDLSESQFGVANTASGVTPMYGIELKTVSVGEISISNVEAGVVVGSFPKDPLLGMSFLGQLDMLREGNRMDLKRRY